MPAHEPMGATTGLVAALVRAGIKRFRYRNTVHRLVGFRPPGAAAIARPGRHGAIDLTARGARIDAMVAAAPPSRWVDARTGLPARALEAPLVEPAVPRAHAAPPPAGSAGQALHATALGARLPPSATAPAAPARPATMAVEPPIREPDGVREATRPRSAVEPAIAAPLATAGPLAAAAAAPPPAAVTSLALPPPPWGAHTTTTSAASRSSAVVVPDVAAPRRATASETDDRAGEPHATARAAPQPATRADPRGAASAVAPSRAARTPPVSVTVDRASPPDKFAGPAGATAATIAMPGGAAQRVPLHRTISPTQQPTAALNALSGRPAAQVSARSGREPAVGTDVQRAPLVPLRSTLPPARSRAAPDARLQDKVLELTREVAALRHSQREASRGTAAPRLNPPPGAPLIRTERAIRVPTDMIWARRHLGPLRLRVSR